MGEKAGRLRTPSGSKARDQANELEGAQTRPAPLSHVTYTEYNKCNLQAEIQATALPGSEQAGVGKGFGCLRSS